jgi:hypothetical protein
VGVQSGLSTGQLHVAQIRGIPCNESTHLIQVYLAFHSVAIGTGKIAPACYCYLAVPETGTIELEPILVDLAESRLYHD